jgi:hypothetical protein
MQKNKVYIFSYYWMGNIRLSGLLLASQIFHRMLFSLQDCVKSLKTFTTPDQKQVGL